MSNTYYALENPQTRAKYEVRFEQGQWITHLNDHLGSGRYHKSFHHFYGTQYRTGNPYQLPSGYHTYSLSCGDGTDYTQESNFNSSTFGAYVTLPLQPTDGMVVKCKTFLAKGTSSANECMVARIPTNGGRKYVDEFGNVSNTNPTDHVISTNAWSTRESHD